MLCADLRAKASQDRMKENLNPAATWQKQIHFDTEVDKSVGKIWDLFYATWRVLNESYLEAAAKKDW